MSNDWDAPIPASAEQEQFTVLPAGRYRFEVTKFERGTSNGESSRGKAMAKLTLKLFDADKGLTGRASENLVVNHPPTAWKVLQFFTAIGQRQHGQKDDFFPNWGKVPGASGECEVEVESFTKRDGSTGESNKVKRFLDMPGVGQPTPF